MELITYQIDKDYNIINLSDNWYAFAVENSGAEKNYPSNVIGFPLWNFITGIETKHLYQIMLKEVRDKYKQIRVFFRCDAPTIRRYLKLSIIPLEHGIIEFQSQTIKVESRYPIGLLDSRTKRSEEFIRICSMCKKIAISDCEWIEIEEAINTLRIFEQELVPQLTHGFCKCCFDLTMLEIKK